MGKREKKSLMDESSL